MSLNPSCNSVVGEGFPNLGDPPFPLQRFLVAQAEILKVFDIFSNAKLDVESHHRSVYKKGTKVYRDAMMGAYGFTKPGPGDIEDVVFFLLKVEAYGWTFRRNWYYWVCRTEKNPVLKEDAGLFNLKWGSQVRVEGFAGGTDVTGDVSSYHVDTPVGLAALARLIKGDWEP